MEGYMECNVLNIRRTLRGAGRNNGAIWILNDNCSTTFLQAYEREREDVIMERGRDCLYFGVAPGEEQGAEVIFDGAYKIETEEFITGEMYLEMSSVGADCSGYRPFEMEYLEPLDEEDYAELEEDMQEALGIAREILNEHQEQIDTYMEETDGGLALGGRNAVE